MKNQAKFKHICDSWYRQNKKNPIKYFLQNSVRKSCTFLVCHARPFDFGIKDYIFIRVFSDPQYIFLYLPVKIKTSEKASNDCIYVSTTGMCVKNREGRAINIKCFYPWAMLKFRQDAILLTSFMEDKCFLTQICFIRFTRHWR